MLFSKKLGEAKVDDPRWSVSYREKAAPDYNSHKDGNSYPVIDTGDLLVLAPFAVLGAAALVVVVVRRRRRQEDARGGDAA